MRVMNVMLSRDWGGVQQSFLDYAAALKISNIATINITSIKAEVNNRIQAHHKLLNINSLDIFSAYYLKSLVQRHNISCVIAHGGRAVKFLRRVKVPIIGVAHDYSYHKLQSCDFIFSITNHLRDYLVKNGYDPKRILIIPNCIDTNITSIQEISEQTTIVIGCLARLVHKKGIDIFLHALSILQNKGCNFKAIIAGDGIILSQLIKLAHTLNIQNRVKFVGWTDDKANFFQRIDIFCLPSLHEPFGIVLLEAMLYKKPIVATMSEGPQEIIKDGFNGLLCNVNDPLDLANKLEIMLYNSSLRHKIAQHGFSTVKEKYDIKIFAALLQNYLHVILNKQT